MRKATPLFLMLLLAVPCLAKRNQLAGGAPSPGQGQAAPAGPSLDFTLNYINAAIRTPIEIKGTRMFFKITGHKDNKSDRPVDVAAYLDLLDVASTLPAARDFTHGEIGVSIDCKCLQYVDMSGLTYGYAHGYITVNDPMQVLPFFQVNGDLVKAQDVANAFQHLIVLVKAQHDADTAQRKKQNENDPFASSQ